MTFVTFHSSNSWLGFVLAIRPVLKKILGFFSWQKKDKFSCTIFSAVIMNEWLKYKRATQEQNTLDWNEHTNSHLLTKILLNYIRVEFYWKLIFFTILYVLYHPMGFPGGTRVKEPAYKYRRHKSREFNPRARKIPWRRTWQPTPVFLPGESHGQRSLAGSIGSQRVRHNWLTFIFSYYPTSIRFY